MQKLTQKYKSSNRMHIDAMHNYLIAQKFFRCRITFLCNSLNSICTIIISAQNGRFYEINKIWYLLIPEIDHTSCSSLTFVTLAMITKHRGPFQCLYQSGLSICKQRSKAFLSMESNWTLVIHYLTPQTYHHYINENTQGQFL